MDWFDTRPTEMKKNIQQTNERKFKLTLIAKSVKLEMHTIETIHRNLDLSENQDQISIATRANSAFNMFVNSD